MTFHSNSFAEDFKYLNAQSNGERTELNNGIECSTAQPIRAYLTARRSLSSAGDPF